MTRFQKKVLELVKMIPKGKVSTYRMITEAIGSKAYRAVGSALRKNPKMILIPCHRVVKSDGRIGKYSGKGGINGKAALLREEGIMISAGKIENFNKVIFQFKKGR